MRPSRRKLKTLLSSRVAILEAQADMFRQLDDSYIQILVELLKIHGDLECKLLRYDNSHTPSAKQPIGGTTSKNKKDKDAESENSNTVSKSPGAQKGHPGTTNKRKPTKFMKQTKEYCSRCGGSDLSVSKTNTRTITDVYVTSKLITTKYVIETCHCSGCGMKDIEPDTFIETDENGDPIDVEQSVQQKEREEPVAVNNGQCLLTHVKQLVQQKDREERGERRTSRS